MSQHEPGHGADEGFVTDEHDACVCAVFVERGKRLGCRAARERAPNRRNIVPRKTREEEFRRLHGTDKGTRVDHVRHHTLAPEGRCHTPNRRSAVLSQPTFTVGPGQVVGNGFAVPDKDNLHEPSCNRVRSQRRFEACGDPRPFSASFRTWHQLASRGEVSERMNGQVGDGPTFLIRVVSPVYPRRALSYGKGQGVWADDEQ